MDNVDLSTLSREEVLKRSLVRYRNERDWFQMLLDGLSMMPELSEEDILQQKLLHILLESKQTVLDCAENNKPFIAGYFCNAPEVFHAMDLPGTCSWKHHSWQHQDHICQMISKELRKSASAPICVPLSACQFIISRPARCPFRQLYWD